MKDSSGRETAIHVPVDDRLADGDLLPRLAAARRIGSLDAAAARELAERYQLATEHTSFVVVDVRADGEKATRVPDTVAVPHMLAAGWGASSRVLRQSDSNGRRVVQSGHSHEGFRQFQHAAQLLGRFFCRGWIR